jgi:hypothetical protein
MVATGSNLAEKPNRVNVPSGCRRDGTFTWWPSMSLMAFTPPANSSRAPCTANVRAQSIRASASGSMGEPSENGPAMSTSRAAMASSSVSVAPHIANRNPPRSTKPRSRSATLFLSAGTCGSPWRRAVARSRSRACTNHGASRKPRWSLFCWPVKSSWCRWIQSNCARSEPSTSSSQILA